jgi:hypothetical protein
MFVRLLTVSLIFGWISLSAFDLLEDLKVASSDSAYAQSGSSHSAEWSRHPSLANNIVEYAVNAHADYTSLLQVDGSEPFLRLVWLSPRVLELHKLHRVFLI